MGLEARIERSLEEQPTLVEVRLDDGALQHAILQNGAAVLLDDTLDSVATRPVAAGPTARLLAAGAGLDHLAIADGGSLMLVLGDHAIRVLDMETDAAAFLGDRVIATVPGTDGHRLVLIDPSTGGELTEAHIDADDAAATIIPHPTEAIALVEFAMGQDGCLVFRIELDDDRLVVQEVLTGQDPVIAGFDRAGTRLLVTPHPSDPDALRVLSWPSLDELARLTAENLDTEIGVGLPACWVDDDRVALYAMEDALVIADALLRSPERVTLPIVPGDDGDVESLVSLAPGRIAVGTWTPQGRATLVIAV